MLRRCAIILRYSPGVGADVVAQLGAVPVLVFMFVRYMASPARASGATGAEVVLVPQRTESESVPSLRYRRTLSPSLSSPLPMLILSTNHAVPVGSVQNSSVEVAGVMSAYAPGARSRVVVASVRVAVSSRRVQPIRSTVVEPLFQSSTHSFSGSSPHALVVPLRYNTSVILTVPVAAVVVAGVVVAGVVVAGVVVAGVVVAGVVVAVVVVADVVVAEPEVAMRENPTVTESVVVPLSFAQASAYVLVAFTVTVLLPVVALDPLHAFVAIQLFAFVLLHVSVVLAGAVPVAVTV